MDALSSDGEDGAGLERDSKPDGRIGSLVDGRYTILEAMASGSMGVVYKAERIPVGKIVAIKFLHASFASDPEFLSRFERETRVMSKLTHPNCVSVVDFGMWNGAPYLVMEFVKGTTLRAVIDDGPVPPPRALILARQIAAGLAHAHAQGIVHRDVKPANIMISEEIGTGEHVRILDFGLARLRGAVGRDATQSNVVVGTPNYMAPEQTIGGGTIDARTDVYAVGVVLFEMVAGDRPFTSDDTLQLLGMHRAAPIPKLVDRMTDPTVLPDGLQELIEKAMAKSPGDRYQSAIELADGIDAVVGGRARARTLAEQAGKAERLATAAPMTLDITHDRIVHSDRILAIADRSDHGDRASERREGGSWLGSLLFVLFLLGGAGAAVWYIKLRNPGEGKAVTQLGSAGSNLIAGSAAGSANPIGSGNATGSAGSGSGVGSAGLAGSSGSAGSVVAAGSGSAGSSAEPTGSGSAGSSMFEASGSGEGSAVAVPVGDLGSGAGSNGAGSGAPAGEIEMDPTTAEDLDPAAKQPDVDDEASDAPKTAEDVEKLAPVPPTLASSIPEALQLVKDGKREVALASLRSLWKKSPNSSTIPFLLGNLYFDQRWWGVAMDHYRIAITKNAGYRYNPTLNRNIIKMLASKKTSGKADYFIKKTIGRPALPYLKAAAAHDGNATVRKWSAALARSLRCSSSVQSSSVQ